MGAIVVDDRADGESEEDANDEEDFVFGKAHRWVGVGSGGGALAGVAFFAEDFFEVSADGDDADDHEFFGGEEGDE